MSDFVGLIGLARKAGYVIVGQENLIGYDKKLYLILLDKTAGNSLLREVNFLSKKKNLEVVSIENLSEKIKIENCKVVGIKNKNFAEAIVKSVKGE